jgi:hypothetical protein
MIGFSNADIGRQVPGNRANPRACHGNRQSITFLRGLKKWKI